MSSCPSIYGDNTVLINNLFIQIYKYYFPLGTSKTIFYQEIDQIIYHPQESLSNIWGPPCNHLNNWFPLDELRKYKKAYFQILLKNDPIRPSFSPVDPQVVYQLLWKNHSVDAKKFKNSQMSIQKTSNETQKEKLEKNNASSQIQINLTEIKSKQNIQKQFNLFGVVQKEVNTQQVAFRDISNINQNNEKKHENEKKKYCLKPININNCEENDKYQQTKGLLERNISKKIS